MKAVLGLENGQYFFGEGFGEEGETCGELVFTTQMTGYMEALTDPSYHGQILLFTYPLIGNYGVDRENFQNSRVWAEGCVVHEVCNNITNSSRLSAFFEDNNLIGIAGIDTRRLTINIRNEGFIRGVIMNGSDDWEAAVEKACNVPDITTQSLIPDVCCRSHWQIQGKGPRIAVLDLGIKSNMLKSLQSRGGDLHIFPYNTKPDEILSYNPDGLFISNGPGDPEMARETVDSVSQLLGQLPVFGICMGNQICGLSLGGKTKKMKFGHRGANQPVKNIDGKIAITSQNHGFMVDGDSLPEGCRVTYTNCNDGTLEGFDDEYLEVFCVQFHPEAHAGPHDTEKLFFDDMFRRLV